MAETRAGTQALERGLRLLDAVAEGTEDLDGLADHLGTSRSTVHRLASTLVHLRYLSHTPRKGYSLGPRVIELGFRAHSDLHLPAVARPHLEQLVETTRDTVHLGILDGSEVIYIDKLPGKREVQMASRIGLRMPAQTTSLGKVLLAGLPGPERRKRIIPGLKRTEQTITGVEEVAEQLRTVAEQGYAFDLEENETNIRCVAAPIKGASGEVVASASVASVALYMSPQRMMELVPIVRAAAHAVSRDLGWTGA